MRASPSSSMPLAQRAGMTWGLTSSSSPANRPDHDMVATYLCPAEHRRVLGQCRGGLGVGRGGVLGPRAAWRPQAKRRKLNKIQRMSHHGL
jgi:hypothetical protein